MSESYLGWAWMVPISAQSGIAHYMPEIASHLVRPLCGYGQFNPYYAEVRSDAKFCHKCLEAQIRMEDA